MTLCSGSQRVKFPNGSLLPFQSSSRVSDLANRSFRHLTHYLHAGEIEDDDRGGLGPYEVGCQRVVVAIAHPVFGFECSAEIGPEHFGVFGFPIRQMVQSIDFDMGPTGLGRDRVRQCGLAAPRGADDCDSHGQVARIRWGRGSVGVPFEPMASQRQPPIDYIERITNQYVGLGYRAYQWIHADDAPEMAALSKPLSECRVGMLATGGVYRQGQTAFTHKDDVTYRAIPSGTDVGELSATHFAYDLTDARVDVNVVYPTNALHELVDAGVIGELAPSFFTCMGGIYSARRVREELAPAIVQRCLDDEIDVMLLVPV